MKVYLSAYVTGALAALSVPRRLRGSSMTALVKPGDLVGARRGDPEPALRATRSMLRLLARARLPWWRNTCLYRAVAECVVLRRYGVPCRLELGVTRSGDGAAIGAHAWVVRGDGGTEPSATPMIVLR